MTDAYRFFVLLLIGLVRDSDGDCVLSLNKDFASPGPVYISNGDFLGPNKADGTVSLQESERILVACPGTHRKLVVNNSTTTYNAVDIQCKDDTTFLLNGRKVKFNAIRCNMAPFYTTTSAREPCADNSYIYEVGYGIQENFYSLYHACFDANELKTHYVRHELTPLSVYLQSGFKRPLFSEGKLFGKIKMAQAYKLKNQKKLLEETLGPNMAEKYLNQNQFLTRGHLAARADFTTTAEMRASFHYVNTAPQWLKHNAGDWAALEESLRRRVQTKGTSVIVFTGTHGVMTLPDVKGHMQKMYLQFDENNNGVAPVPMYFYKVVYDPEKKEATAFVSINSSFYNQTYVNQLEDICQNVCEGNPNFSWLTWSRDGGNICCGYTEFQRRIKYLPELEVLGLYY